MENDKKGVFKLTENCTGGQFRVFGKARISSAKTPVKQVLLKMPACLKDRIGSVSIGHEQTVCLGLIEYALELSGDTVN